MAYYILKIIAQLALKVYFRKIQIEGGENLPEKGPFLIVSNHPSSFLDPINIAVNVKQKISFLAKAVMFENKIIASLLRGLNMVPIYRAQDDPSVLSKNREVFRKCYEKLHKKGVILIFPEGTSEMERRLRKIKTGAARIALGAEKEYDFKLGVKIVPVGLNYTKSSRFRSELFVHFSEAIDVKDYMEDYHQDEIATAKELTDKIEQDIRNLIIAIDKEEYDDFVEQIESIYKNELIKKFEEFDHPATDIRSSQEIFNAVKYYQENDPELFDTMKSRINSYFSKLESIRLTDRNIQLSVENRFYNPVKLLIVIILGFPLWLFGIINSYIPYKLPRYIALKITHSEAFYGALLMSLGTVIFILFYSLEVFFVWKFTHHLYFTLLFGAMLPISGFFTIYYSRIARRMYYKWLLVFKFYSKNQIVTSLFEERKNIIARLEEIRQNYLAL